MDLDKARLLRERLGERLIEGESLHRYTSYRIGGPADFFYVAESAEELARAFSTARQAEIPCLVLGLGTNMLVADAGVRGLVIQNRSRAFRFQEPAAMAGGGRACDVVLVTESGVVLGNLARKTARLGLSGLEFGEGIPGTVGGAVVSNAGAHGHGLHEVLIDVRILDGMGVERVLGLEELRLAYRDSRFRQAGETTEALVRRETTEIILEVRLALTGEPEAALAERVETFSQSRREKQPRGPSAGSVFKNPEGQHAAWLLEQVGMKGRRLGHAQISEKHANFILNLGKARAADVLNLIEEGRAAVRRAFGVNLDLEVELVGDWEFCAESMAATSFA